MFEPNGGQKPTNGCPEKRDQHWRENTKILEIKPWGHGPVFFVLKNLVLGEFSCLPSCVKRVCFCVEGLGELVAPSCSESSALHDSYVSLKGNEGIQVIGGSFAPAMRVGLRFVFSLVKTW